jgi:hypothetical protein
MESPGQGGRVAPPDPSDTAALALAAKLRSHLLVDGGDIALELHQRGVRHLGQHNLHYPGRKPPFWAVMRPVRPYIRAIENRFTMGNAAGA